MALRENNLNQLNMAMPPYIKNYGSEPKLTPEDYWIKFCEYMYLTQGVDAEKRSNLIPKERIQRMLL